ncbi:sensor histidine kinase [Cryptosporangium minutisporangium]|uniref:histidine kinase n=1 Tax=Cryptosporangium minutisporangium TaxID=113569 RepID=A0ABP6SQY5_9ACTN
MNVAAAACVLAALLLALVRPGLRGSRGPIVLAGSVSLLITLVSSRDGALSAADSVLGLVETGALLILIGVTARRPGQLPFVLPGAVAVGAWLLRVEPPTSATILFGCATWFAAALGAAGIGAYLGSLDAARQRAAAEARAAQRTLMARELHDFVAHDVSEVLALAQAGRVLAPAGSQLAELVHGIETSARSALASMDRTLDLLDGALDLRHPAPSLADVNELVGRFSGSFPADVRLELGAGLPAGVPREAGAAAYRVVMEALTNVRRHAPSASRVDVRLRRDGGQLVVEVTDDGGDAVVAARGGRGLVGLTERIRLLGGSLDAGPRERRGWRTTATLPVSGR